MARHFEYADHSENQGHKNKHSEWISQLTVPLQAANSEAGHQKLVFEVQ